MIKCCWDDLTLHGGPQDGRVLKFWYQDCKEIPLPERIILVEEKPGMWLPYDGDNWPHKYEYPLALYYRSGDYTYEFKP